MLKKLLKCLMVASVITPAAVSPAVAGCCGAYPVSGTINLSQTVEGGSLTTTDTVTNTSMQMVVTEDATFIPTSAAPQLGSPDDSGSTCSGEVM